MRAKRISLWLVIILNLVLKGEAQDLVYSQFYANPVYLNPALAGSKLVPRVTLNYRNQWPGIRKGYVSYHASWDKHYDALSGSLGVIINNEDEGDGVYKTFSASGIYCYGKNVTKNIELEAALQAGYLNYSLNWDKLLMGDQMIDVNTGALGPTHDYVPEKLKVGNVDFSAGLLAGYKSSYYLGVAVNHLTRPDISFYDNNTYRLNMKWTFHTGMLIDIIDGLGETEINGLSISPNVVYVQQGKFHQLNAGMYVNKYPFVMGLWLRHNFGNPDAIIVMLGFSHKQYKIGYSFDYTISRVTIKSGGAHEISLAWLFHSNKLSPKRFNQIISPDF